MKTAHRLIAVIVGIIGAAHMKLGYQDAAVVCFIYAVVIFLFAGGKQYDSTGDAVMETLLVIFGGFCAFCSAVSFPFFTGMAALMAALYPLKVKRKQKPKPVDIPPALLGTARELDGDDRLTPDSWVVLDVETTGLQAQSDRVIEIAMRKYEDGEPGETFTSLINPGMPLPGKIVELTGIKDRDLKKAPRFADITWRISAFIGGVPVVAHNARFDVEFLLSEWARAGLTRDVAYIDTVKLSREAFPGLKNYKLATLIERFNLLDHAQEHRALSDADAAGKLYLLCRQQLPVLRARQQREREAAEAVREEKRRREEEAKRKEQERREERLRQESASSGKSRAATLSDLGRQYEAEGDIDKAVYYYSQALAEGADTLYPYKRLAVLHRKRKEYADELRVCIAAVQMLEWQVPINQNAITEFENRAAFAREKMGAEAGAHE